MESDIVKDLIDRMEDTSLEEMPLVARAERGIRGPRPPRNKKFPKDHLLQDCKSMAGKIRLGIGGEGGAVLRSLNKFKTLYPQIQIEVKEEASPEAFDKIDMMIGPALVNCPDLIQSPFFLPQSQLYASQDYVNTFGIPQKLEDLDHHRLIAYTTFSALIPAQSLNWPLCLGKETNQERSPFIEVDLREQGLELSSAGLGITAAFPEDLLLKNFELMEVLKNVKGPKIQCYCLYPVELGKVKRFEILREYLLTLYQEDAE